MAAFVMLFCCRCNPFEWIKYYFCFYEFIEIILTKTLEILKNSQKTKNHKIVFIQQIFNTADIFLVFIFDRIFFFVFFGTIFLLYTNL